MDDTLKICPTCGSSDVSEPVVVEPAPVPEVTVALPDINDNGNVLAGIVGAFLFSIIGGALYFLIYQGGYIAGICGLVIFVLANFGYGLFARTKNKYSVVALISSVVVMVVMIFVAEYLCLSYEIFTVYKDLDITFFDAVRATPEFMTYPEVTQAVIGDLALAYLFGFLAIITNVINVFKARKQIKSK